MNGISYEDRPSVVVWEAAAGGGALGSEEARSLIDEVSEILPRMFVWNLGTCGWRDDLIDLIQYADAMGLRLGLTVGAWRELSAWDLRIFREAGVMRLALGVQGATRASHERAGGTRRSWTRTMRVLRAARAAGLPYQINTTVDAENLRELDAMAGFVERLEPASWNIHLSVPHDAAGRAKLPSATAVEALFVRLCEISQLVSFPIQTTQGPQYRRVLVQNTPGPERQRNKRLSGVNDGKGMVFVSEAGEICPSESLRVSCGNVRDASLLEVYRSAPLFRQLRDPDALKGRCRRCEFRLLCGGSRSRARALTGDPLAEDPLCVYQPVSVHA